MFGEIADGVSGPLFTGPEDVLTKRFTTDPETKPVPVMTKESPIRIGDVTLVMLGGAMAFGVIAPFAPSAHSNSSIIKAAL
jgi:hypothetical protein